MGIIPEDNARGKLFYAFLELIKKKPYARIKVCELIDRAQVNRSTFYRYYSDIFDFYDRICSSGLIYITEGFENCLSPDGIKAGLDAVYSLVTCRIDSLAAVIKMLTGKNGSVTFLKSFRGYLLEKLEECFAPRDEDDANLTQLCAERLYIYLLKTAVPDTIIPADIGECRYDPKKGVIENIIDFQAHGSGEVFRGIMTAAATIFLTKEPRSLNVSRITDSAKVGRTEFYNYFGNIKKLVDSSLISANRVCTQELFAVSVCGEDEFFDLLSPCDLKDTVNSDIAIELARKHREYYAFIVSNYEFLLKTLRERLYEKGLELTCEQLSELESYCAWATINFVAYSDGLRSGEFRSKIMWARKRLEDSGICL